MGLHPAENRGYRELYAFSRQFVEHWSVLAERLGAPTSQVLERGASAGRDLIQELGPLTATHGLHGQPAAQGVGVSLGRHTASLRDRFLERNQAARLAVEDIQHVVTLLAYLASVSATSGNSDLAGFCERWQRKLRRIENEARRAVAEMGSDPDGAVEALDGSALGRAAHSLGYAAGTLGEWVDRRAATRR